MEKVPERRREKDMTKKNQEGEVMFHYILAETILEST